MPKYSKKIQELPKKIQEFPKHSRITKKFPRFWKYPIPYIALREAKNPFGLVRTESTLLEGNILTKFVEDFKNG